MSATPKTGNVEKIELGLLLEAVYRRYGYDFRDYAEASIRRRILKRVHAEGLKSISGFQERILHDPTCFTRLLTDLTVKVTDFFEGPDFHSAFRQKVVPLLRTYPFVRLWHAGCATGEEVYSMAILLHEEKIYDRCRLYATDIDQQVLDKARSGIFPLPRMKQFAENYIRAGGKASFNEFNSVICRNVMIYFNTKPVGKGTGLGLTTARGLVENHGGSIGCHSIPGKGTDFTIQFKVKKEKREGGQP